MRHTMPDRIGYQPVPWALETLIYPTMPPLDLSVQLGPATLKNPILTASGTCGYGHEYAPILDFARQIGRAHV